MEAADQGEGRGVVAACPRVLRMQWFWDPMPTWVAANAAEWRAALAPIGWEVELLDTVPAACAAEWRAVYELAPTGRFRADLVRYWLMHDRGGAYVDADTRPAARVREIEAIAAAATGPVLVLARFGAVEAPDNCFLLSPPGHEFWAGCLARCRVPETWAWPRCWFGGCNVYGDLGACRVLAPEWMAEATMHDRKWHGRGRREDLVDVPALMKHYRMDRVRGL